MARALVAEVLPAGAGETVLDPACGAGAFLVAAAERRGTTAGVAGIELDPIAADIARFTLALSEHERTGRWCDHGDRVAVGDGLLAEPPGGQPDVVVGNPPFAGQLRALTARPGPQRRALERSLRPLAGPYTDTAALFLARAARLVGEDGRVVLVQPASFLGARDTAAVRDAVTRGRRLRVVDGLDPAGFGVGTPLVAVVLEPAGVGSGNTATPAPHRGQPGFGCLPRSGVFGDLATVAAGFRAAYYGLVPHVREAGEGEPDGTATAALVTVGLVDPAHVAWGERPVRFAKRRWQRPVVELDRLEPALRDELHRPGRPRLLVASQTRVPELAVDPTGATVPVTPLIRATPHDGADLWRLAALGASPVAARAAADEAAGTGRSATALRISAGLVRRLPLPAHTAPWSEAADLVRRAQGAPAPDRHRLLMAAARRMLAAHGLEPDDPLLGWWAQRLPAVGSRAHVTVPGPGGQQR